MVRTCITKKKLLLICSPPFLIQCGFVSMACRADFTIL